MKSKAKAKKGCFKELNGGTNPLEMLRVPIYRRKTLRKLFHVNLSIRVGERFLVGQRPMPIGEMGRTTNM